MQAEHSLKARYLSWCFAGYVFGYSTRRVLTGCSRFDATCCAPKMLDGAVKSRGPWTGIGRPVDRSGKDPRHSEIAAKPLRTLEVVLGVRFRTGVDIYKE